MDSGAAFLEFVRAHGDKAYNFAYRLAGNEADARDLVSEALARAFEHRDSYDPDRPFDSWLLRILQNIFLDGVRRYERRHTVSLDAKVPGLESSSWDQLLPGGEPNPEEAMIRKETDALVQRALDALPVHYRSAVILSDIEGCTYDRIAQIMSCPIGTVRSRIHQGRALMRKAFDSLAQGGSHGRS